MNTFSLYDWLLGLMLGIHITIGFFLFFRRKE